MLACILTHNNIFGLNQHNFDFGLSRLEYKWHIYRKSIRHLQHHFVWMGLKCAILWQNEMHKTRIKSGFCTHQQKGFCSNVEENIKQM